MKIFGNIKDGAIILTEKRYAKKGCRKIVRIGKLTEQGKLLKVKKTE
jgi:hypothetical protein